VEQNFTCLIRRRRYFQKYQKGRKMTKKLAGTRQEIMASREWWAELAFCARVPMARRSKNGEFKKKKARRETHRGVDLKKEITSTGSCTYTGEKTCI